MKFEPKLPILAWFYRRLGKRYPTAFVAFELQSAYLVSLGTIGIYSFYYEGSGSDFVRLAALLLALTAISVTIAVIQTHRRLVPVREWIGGRRDPDSTVAAWRAAVTLPLAGWRRDWHQPIAVIVIPGAIAGVIVLDLHWSAVFPLVAGGCIALAYASMLHYFALETGMRPVIVDICGSLPAQFEAGPSALPLRTKLIAALPLINIITGITVAGFTSAGGGTARLGLDVLVTVAVAFTISMELTLLLSRSLLRPIGDIQMATERIKAGDFSVAVPVTTSDELGQLAAEFNEMAAGLAEREQLREAFGTYLDREVAEHILREGISPTGADVEVSILFCDVREFTRLAGEAEATEVVAQLNQLFECAVPVVAAHGGHVDKFIGDGFLAVFGAPEPHSDHADRAVAAALEIADRVGRGEAGPMRIGLGISSGRVIAGSIGGAGRLNFSVIGDAVNVAARVEHETRSTGDDLLISEATRALLRREFRTEPRGSFELKGKDEPMPLYSVLPLVGVPARQGQLASRRSESS